MIFIWEIIIILWYISEYYSEIHVYQQQNSDLDQIISIKS